MNIQQFDFSIDLLECILWRYDKATNYQSLLTQKQAWYTENQTTFWENWYRDVFNLETANEFGLQVWSIILNIPLFIAHEPDANQPTWGFEQYYKNFDRGVFGREPDITGLTIPEKRLILRLRFFQLVSRCAIPEINAFYKFIFGTEGPVYLLDGLDMSIVMVFDFPINPKLVEIIKKYDVIPRGTGVLLRYRISPSTVWGFGPYHRNFDNGTFAMEI